jgi:hypothetical protein
MFKKQNDFQAINYKNEPIAKKKQFLYLSIGSIF